MSATRYASVLGLGFGDCGKGLFVDALTRRWQAHTVVRCNGGAQAGHNVRTPPEPGRLPRHHTFSQFGAGTLVPGVRTLLLEPMVVHPTALLVEAEALGRIGIDDALARLGIDEQCLITTPFHQAAGRLRELARGTFTHGTCGVGVGETVRHALEYPGQGLRYIALSAASGVSPALERLHAIRELYLAEFSGLDESLLRVAAAEMRILQDETLPAHWLATARALGRQCPPLASGTLAKQLHQPGCVLFEGAQGVLLDEWRGFHPHTTWSSISTRTLDGVAQRFGIGTPIAHHGVLRTYQTRHGPGPLPTHDVSLDTALPEPDNHGVGWQGPFRRGHPDAVLLRYALEAIGNLSGLLLTHLDVFERGRALKWCPRYRLPDTSAVERLAVAGTQDLHHQAALTQLLNQARPDYDMEPIRRVPEFLERLAGVTNLPVRFRSFGPTSADVQEG